MEEKSSDPGQGARPTDFETLYSRAQVQGTRYWDFSSSRKELRGQFRQRTAGEQAAKAATAVSARQPGESVPVPPFEPPARKGPVAVPEVVPERENPPQPGARDRTRWYALHALFATPELAINASSAQPLGLDRRPPTVAVFSFAGGVGKTCLVATLGRALAALGEHVLLADTASCGLLPFYFGSRESKPGVVRTFFPSGSKSDAPVQVVSLEVERYPNDGGEQDPLLEKLVRDGHRANRILVDVATAGRQVTSRLLPLRPTILVPMLPDMSSVACLGSLETLLSNTMGRNGEALYLLNQFDESSPLHREVREMLQQRLGGRLLPFTLRRSPAVSEGLAEGMTVIDYASESGAADDYRNLAGWLHSFAAPAAIEYGGRWSER